jgi:CspA family cold shock protein
VLLIGTVKYWNAKGFGFISRDDHANDVFVHVSQVQRAGLGDELKIGQRLEFDTAQDERKSDRLRAVDIRLVG